MPSTPDVAREVGTVLVAAGVYFGARLVVQGDADEAASNAERILAFERSIGIDVEHGLQSIALDHRFLEVLGNLSYVWLHWPLLIGALLVLHHREPTVYLRLRRALVASGTVGLVLFWALPAAPPRFMPGFEGTVSDSARRHFLGYPLEWANPYASFPSFHVGWTLIACLAVAATMADRRARVLAVVPALLVGLAVVTTGNHYVVDAVVGAVIALAAYAAAGQHEPRRASVATGP